MDFIGCSPCDPLLARLLPVGPRVRGIQPRRQRIDQVDIAGPTLIVLPISGESRATVPFARPKKIYRHGGFEDSRVRSICVVDRATTTTARVISAHGPETDMHEPTIVVARLEKQRKPMCAGQTIGR